MSAVTTHVLDTARGTPAPGVSVVLERVAGDVERVASAVSDTDGRVGDLGPAELPPGTYRLRFDTGSYFARTGADAFFPEVVVAFQLSADEHYHVPLLLSPYSYSTYRGS